MSNERVTDEVLKEAANRRMLSGQIVPDKDVLMASELIERRAAEKANVPVAWLRKYETENALSSIHHYETTEVKDEYNRLVVPSGLQVDSNYSITYSKLDNALVTISPVKSVTNYEYEINENILKVKLFLKN